MSKAYNILIVDDSATTRAMIKRVIRMTDLPIATLFEASDGGAALKVLEAQINSDPVDLILTDLNMPNMDGMEMTRQIRQSVKFRSLPVVVITARPDDEASDQLKLDGVQGWLVKPFTPEHVRDVVQQLLSVPMGQGEGHA